MISKYLTNVIRMAHYFCLVGGAAAPAWAFNVDGLKSGMTTQELTEEASRRGLELKSVDGSIYFMGKFEKHQIDATMAFCKGRLVSLNRSVDIDIDYHTLLSEILGQHGQPKVEAIRIPVYQSTGTVPTTTMRWYANGDRITLSSTPEVRDGKGALRFNRGASVEHAVKNSCATVPF